MKDDDFKLLRGFADRRDRRTFVIVESLLRLKIMLLAEAPAFKATTPAGALAT